MLHIPQKVVDTFFEYSSIKDASVHITEAHLRSSRRKRFLTDVRELQLYYFKLLPK